MALARWVGRAIGLDVHRDFCVVAICEDAKLRTGGKVPSTPEGLVTLAESLLSTDRFVATAAGRHGPPWRPRPGGCGQFRST
ncbi:MAG: hypothetical protein ACRDPA_27515 [Solirubrobacteraceae bacterium]